MKNLPKLLIQKFLKKMESVKHKKLLSLITLLFISSSTVFAAFHFSSSLQKTSEPTIVNTSKKDGSANGTTTTGGTSSSSTTKNNQPSSPGGNTPSTATTSTHSSPSGSTAPSTATGNQQPTPGDTSLNYSRIQWEGGSSYWSRFPKSNAAGWTNPNFFPITIFYGKADPTYVASLKDAGINTFAPPEHDPSTFPITNITDQGMYVIGNINEYTPAEVGASNNRVVGWFMSDECDMGYSGCDNGTSGQTASNYATSVDQSYVNKARSYNDGRFVMANFGNGILRTFWASYNAASPPYILSVAPTDMHAHMQMMDVTSADKYTYTSPAVDGIVPNSPDWPINAPVARAYSYGWQADQIKRFQDTAHPKPIWTFIETAMPYLTEQGARTIQPDQIEGAVWSAIIHEARGISYFDHNNNGICGNYAIVDCPDVHAKVKQIDTQVAEMAPILNTQSYYNTQVTINGMTYSRFSFNNGTDTMLKTYNSYAYIIAGLGFGDATGDKSFTLPNGVNGTRVEVMDEGRTLPVTNRSFTDNFSSEYAHHIYKIAM